MRRLGCGFALECWAMGEMMGCEVEGKLRMIKIHRRQNRRNGEGVFIWI